MSRADDQLVSWKQLAPLFADVVVSPWNLLVGGLLIQYLSTGKALLSIVIGYAILAAVFILYGGLGYARRQQSSALLHEVFGNRFSKYVIPVLLALGQIGWGAINISLGGLSLAHLLHWPGAVGMGVYAVIVGVMAGLSLYRLAITKVLIVASAVGLVGYITVAKLMNTSIGQFFAHQPQTEHSLFWGVSIVVASLISFATVTPDFFQSARHRRDVTRATLVGLLLPGMLMVATGCLLFFDQSSYNLVTLIAALAFPLLPHIFNAVTNTDGSMALYTPALKLISLRKMGLRPAVAIVTVISLAIALLNIVNYLPAWLSILAVMSPVFIGVAFAAMLFYEASPGLKTRVHGSAHWIYGLTLAACIATAVLGPPVILALIAPLLLYGAYLQYRMMQQ